MDQEAVLSGSTRSRGRPRKAGKDSPQEDKRARGRQAQRTYVQRKHAETDRLRKRISALQDAIEGMSDEFLKYGERVVTVSPVPAGPTALVDLRNSTEIFLNIARAAEAIVEEDEEAPPATKEVSLSATLSTEAGPLQRASARQAPSRTPHLSPSMGLQMPFELSTIFSLAPSNPPHQTRPPPQLSSEPGYFSPRLDYRLLSGSPPHNPDFSSLWTHYVIAGPNSFATRLYKETLTLMFRVLRGEISIPGFIPSIGRFRFRYETPASFMQLAEGQLSRMTIGGDPEEDIVDMGAAHPNHHTPAAATDASLVLFGPAHPVMSAPLRAQIQTEANYAIGSVAEWLDPWNTQQYLSSRWGLRCSYGTAKISAASVNPFIGGGDRMNDPSLLPRVGFQETLSWDALVQEQSADLSGFFGGDTNVPSWPRSHPELVFNVQSLAEKLIQEAVCFGEGPRFFKERIDAAVREFLGPDL